ncbi:CBASS cGAMP synthase [Undibacterium luofuense]|uniref:CBASS cGAMP synthase n=1 Tax=Undibacterium luofuense TaxID=2828733 RepID=UPI002E30A184|nr:CBASS cGAMP synthase [Undibacterium luofuense]
MTYNFHNYYTDRADGLISKLTLTDERTQMLKELRSRVRTRTKEVFEEAKKLAKNKTLVALSMESFKVELATTRLRHLSPMAQEEIALLIKNMDEQTRTAFLELTPRFWTQGSFQYNTLNNPYNTPPQEMDIDDGAYLPMAIFEDKPVIGHRLLLLLVDSSLQSLVAENKGWEFEAKRTCARIRIPAKNTHIDVPMYAIPEDQFLQKQVALASFHETAFDSVDARADAWMSNRAAYELDSNSVNLALRDGEQKWCKSDPKIVEDWFNESCGRIGRHLRKTCRFMKSWRDAQWDSGGPSSISLMAATVNILDRLPHDSGDFGATMLLIATHLPSEFSNGIESPDHTDEKLLFPHFSEHGEREQQIMGKLHELKEILVEAERSATKELALKVINRAFGQRVTKSDLIVNKQSAPAFKNDPSVGDQSKRISATMSSG